MIICGPTPQFPLLRQRRVRGTAPGIPMTMEAKRYCRRLPLAQAQGPLARARLLRRPSRRRHRRHAALHLLPRHHGARSCAVLLLFVATGMSITMGYHRLFAHRTFKASPIVRFLLLFFGAATFEESALKWSSQHRQHHLLHRYGARSLRRQQGVLARAHRLDPVLAPPHQLQQREGSATVAPGVPSARSP